MLTDCLQIASQGAVAAEANLEQHIAGENSHPRKKYKDVADRLNTLVNGFNAHDKDHFNDTGENAALVGTAHNIGY